MSPTRFLPTILVVSLSLVAGCASSEDAASANSELNDPNDTSPSSTEEIAITGTPACPRVVKVGVRGDSFIGGVKKTFDIKGFIAPGKKLALSRDQEGENIHLLFQAPLAPAFASCEGKSDVTTMFNEGSSHIVFFDNGAITIDVMISPSLVLDLTSTFANQAIFKVFEAG